MSTSAIPIETLLQAGIQCIGALDFDESESALRPRRLPAWTRAQVPQGLDVMVRMPSGVRLEFQSAATEIGLELLVTRMGGNQPVALNLEFDNQVLTNHATQGNTIVPDASSEQGFRVVHGECDLVWFQDLPPINKMVKLWLPHNAFVELHALHISKDSVVEPINSQRPSWVHYGSSISHCMEAEAPAYTWPAVAARHSNLSLINLGVGGQCHLDPLIARTIRDLEADLISIKSGINIVNMDSMRERVFVPLLHGFLDTIRDRHTTTPIILCSPIYCPSAESRPGPTIPNEKGKFVTFEGMEQLRQGSLTLQRIRTLVKQVVETRTELGDANLHYFHGLDLFGEADAEDLPDDLHPNPTGYIRMGERFAAHAIAKVFQD